jgi:hypothetical protein
MEGIGEDCHAVGPKAADYLQKGKEKVEEESSADIARAAVTMVVVVRVTVVMRHLNTPISPV